VVVDEESLTIIGEEDLLPLLEEGGVMGSSFTSSQ